MKALLIDLANVLKKHDAYIKTYQWYEEFGIEIHTNEDSKDFTLLDYSTLMDYINSYYKQESSADLHPDLLGGE